MCHLVNAFYSMPTSRTHIETYEALGVGELWRRSGRSLSIYVLQKGKYIEVEESQVFPGLPLKEVIPQYLKRSKSQGRNSVLRDFRRWARKNTKQT